MCMNCGCGEPDDDRGNSANITASDLRAAAAANGQSLRESAEHILQAVHGLDEPGTRRSGLAEPAAASGGQPGGRGTPASES
jgi:hypothetical protein